MDAQPQCKTDTIGLRCGFFEVKNMVYFLIAFAVCIVLFIGAFVLNAAMFRPFRTKTPVQESDGHIVYFTSGRNRLTGLVLNEEGTKGLIILAHGMGTDIRYHLPELHYFAEQGYKVFAFEYSGYRGSTGHFFGFSQAAQDVKCALLLPAGNDNGICKGICEARKAFIRYHHGNAMDDFWKKGKPECRRGTDPFWDACFDPAGQRG